MLNRRERRTLSPYRSSAREIRNGSDEIGQDVLRCISEDASEWEFFLEIRMGRKFPKYCSQMSHRREENEQIEKLIGMVERIRDIWATARAFADDYESSDVFSLNPFSVEMEYLPLVRYSSYHHFCEHLRIPLLADWFLWNIFLRKIDSMHEYRTFEIN